MVIHWSVVHCGRHQGYTVNSCLPDSVVLQCSLLLSSLVTHVRRASEGGGEGDVGPSPGEIPQSPVKERETGVPTAMELFGLEEALLVGRGKKDAEQKREMALKK